MLVTSKITIFEVDLDDVSVANVFFDGHNHFTCKIGDIIVFDDEY